MKKPLKITPKKDRNSVQILGVRVNSTGIAEVLKKINQRIQRQEKTFVVTPNPEFLVFAYHNPWFKLILNKADIAIPDGIGLVWASSIQERISGTDLMEKLCQEATKRGWSVYLLGGSPGIAKKALAALQKRYPGLKGWAETGPQIETKDTSDGGRLERSRSHDSSEVNKWVEKINQRKPTFLFVAFGMGKQEKFIYDNWKKLNVKLAMGVGGAFDYLSGLVPRAPKWIQKIGFEWLYRLIRQPRRWRRQLSLLEFIWLVIKEKFSFML